MINRTLAHAKKDSLDYKSKVLYFALVSNLTGKPEIKYSALPKFHEAKNIVPLFFVVKGEVKSINEGLEED